LRARPAPEGREVGVRVVLSEASSLTAREHLSVLGPAGIGVDVASRSPLAIARFSRWCRRVVRVPRSAVNRRTGRSRPSRPRSASRIAGVAVTTFVIENPRADHAQRRRHTRGQVGMSAPLPPAAPPARQSRSLRRAPAGPSANATAPTTPVSAMVSSHHRLARAHQHPTLPPGTLHPVTGRRDPGSRPPDG
jgi:hypothetical protein